MTLTTHSLAGAVIGKYVKNPWAVIVLAVILHFILDTFRHGEYVESFDKSVTVKNSAGKVILDFCIGSLIVAAYIFISRPDLIQARNMIIGASFSMIPDLITAVYWKFRFKILDKYYHFHSKFLHKLPRGSKEREWNLRNATNDIIISAIAIILLFI